MSLSSSKVSALHHPLESLGLVRIERGEVRVEKLSQRKKPKVPFPHRHDFYQLLWIERGRGRHEIDFHQHGISSGSLFIMKPGQVHSWELVGDVEGTVIEFSSESLQDTRVGFSLQNTLEQLPDVLVLKTAKEKSSMQWLVNEMREEFKAQPAAFALVLESYVRALILKLTRYKNAVGPSAPLAPDLLKLQSLIEINFKHQHGLEFYAQKMGLSPRALTMRTSRQLRKPGRQIIFDRVLLEAKRMLAYTDLAISEIGYELGFEDANHFSRFFKVQAGQTAQAFRARHRFEK